MRNIKKMLLFLTVLATCSIHGMENTQTDALAEFNNCLVAFTCVGDFAHVDRLAYKTGPDAHMCFGFFAIRRKVKVSQDSYSRKYRYKLRVLTKAKLAQNMPSRFVDGYFSDAPSHMRKVTAQEK